MQGTQEKRVQVNDASLVDAIKEALWEDEVIRRSEYDLMEATAQDGIVTLRGHVSNPVHRQKIHEIVSRVSGVRDVRDKLVLDDELEARIAQTLAREPGLTDVSINVTVEYGIAYLHGRLRDSQQRTLAQRAAAGVPGVRAVVPHFSLTEEVGETPPPVVQPRVGAWVYTTEGKMGRVLQVVVDPGHRRVTELVVDGAPPPSNPGEPTPRDMVVVPVELIRSWTSEDVHLVLDSSSARDLPAFHENRYRWPDSRWRPPFPYRRDEVLWPAR